MKIKSRFVPLALILFLFLPSLALAFSGKVVGIADGDTITVLRDGKQQVKIRLYGIDTPKRRQAFGTKAKQFTSDMVFGKVVEGQWSDQAISSEFMTKNPKNGYCQGLECHF